MKKKNTFRIPEKIEYNRFGHWSLFRPFPNKPTITLLSSIVRKEVKKKNVFSIPEKCHDNPFGWWSQL